MIKITVDKISLNFQCLKQVHKGEIDSSEVVTWQLQNEMLQVDKLPEEESLIYKALRPMEVEYSYALAYPKVATIGKQQC